VPGAVAIDQAAQTIYAANGDNTVPIIPATRLGNCQISQQIIR